MAHDTAFVLYHMLQLKRDWDTEMTDSQLKAAVWNTFGQKLLDCMEDIANFISFIIASFTRNGRYPLTAEDKERCLIRFGEQIDKVISEDYDYNLILCYFAGALTATVINWADLYIFCKSQIQDLATFYCDFGPSDECIKKCLEYIISNFGNFPECIKAIERVLQEPYLDLINED